MPPRNKQGDSGEYDSEPGGSGRFQALLSKWKTSDAANTANTRQPTAAADITCATSAAASTTTPRPLKSRQMNRDQARHEFQLRSTNIRISMGEAAGASFVKKALRQPKNVYQKPIPESVLKQREVRSFVHTPEDQAIVLEALQKNFVFAERSLDELKMFVTAFEKCSFPANHYIIKQHDDGDYFYILRSGAVQFIVDGVVVHQTDQTGTSFGELSLLYTCSRCASVQTTAPETRCFRVDQGAFRAISQKHSENSLLEKMELLKGVNFLSSLAGALRPALFQANDLLIEKGAKGDKFWILKSGQVQVKDIEVGTTQYANQTLTAGENAFFGELALATNERRAANVVATTDGMAFTLDRKTFEKVLGSMSGLILRAQDARRLSGIPFIDECNITAKQINSLASLLTDQTWEEGSIIVKAGESVVPALFLIRKGRVELTGRSGTVRHADAGGFFGDELLSLQNTDEGGSQRIISPYSVRVVQGRCVCGILTLGDLLTVFDDTGDETTDAVEEKEIIGEISSNETKKKKTKKVKAPDRLENLQRHTILGEGTFGQAWLVTNKQVPIGKKPKPLCLKIQSKYELVMEGQGAGAVREKSILQELKHPFIIKLLKTYQDEDYLYFLMNMVQGGELFSVMHDQEGKIKLPESQAKFYVLAISDALAFMHRRCYAYRDLKPENVMIDKKGFPILIDLGFAKKIPPKTYTYTLCGTPGYLPPEVIMSIGHDTSADHWSLGILVYEMLLGVNPFYFEGMDQMLLFKSICKDPYERPKGVSQEAVDIIDGFLVKDPALRLGSLARGESDILKHAWFEQLDLRELRKRKCTAPWIPTIKDALDASCFDDWSELEDKSKKAFPKLEKADADIFADF